jgi:hypothetical protein
MAEGLVVKIIVEKFKQEDKEEVKLFFKNLVAVLVALLSVFGLMLKIVKMNILLNTW